MIASALALAPVLGLCSSVPFPQGDAQSFAAVEAALEARAADDEFAGVLAIGYGDALRHVVAFGEADVERGVAHDAATRFKLHSLSKPLTGVVLLRSVDAGRVSLDDFVGEFLADWPLAWGDVTVRHLATHTSGVPDFAETFLAGWKGTALDTWESIAGEFESREPAFAPGSGWAYSNAGYVLLVAVLESVWETSFEDVLREQLTAPAGMASTDLELAPAPGTEPAIEGLAQGYNGAPSSPEVTVSKTYAIPGAGGIVSDAEDLLRFTRALFEGELLSSEMRTVMTTVPAGQSTPYAVGWVIGERDGQPVFRHDGGNNGFVTSLEYYPDRELTIALLSNRGYVRMGALRDEVAALVLDALD